MFSFLKLFSIRNTLAVIAAFCLAAILLSAGCGDAEVAGEDKDVGRSSREIPLQTLAQGANSEYGRIDDLPIPEDAPPEYLVLTDEEELHLLLSQALIQEAVPEVDFDRYIVIAAMLGPKSTGAYAISIMHTSQTGTEVRVEVDVVEPEPGSMTVQILTSPYHLVTAERADFVPRGELVFSFVDGDDDHIYQEFADI